MYMYCMLIKSRLMFIGGSKGGNKLGPLPAPENNIAPSTENETHQDELKYTP